MGVIHLSLTQLVPLFRLSQTIGFLMTIIIGGDSIDHNFMIKPKTPHLNSIRQIHHSTPDMS